MKEILELVEDLKGRPLKKASFSRHFSSASASLDFILRSIKNYRSLHPREPVQTYIDRTRRIVYIVVGNREFPIAEHVLVANKFSVDTVQAMLSSTGVYKATP